MKGGSGEGTISSRNKPEACVLKGRLNLFRPHKIHTSDPPLLPITPTSSAVMTDM